MRSAKTSGDTTVYDPTCGSGSLLLKVADEAGTNVTLYGQEKDFCDERSRAHEHDPGQHADSDD